MSVNIQINKTPKTSIFKSIFVRLGIWSILGFCFYFNYKFIDGNNFLDLMIFLVATLVFIGIVAEAAKSIKNYYNVDDDKINQIEEILNNNLNKK